MTATSVPVPVSRIQSVPFSWVVAAIYLALVVPLASVLNIWQDEAYTMHTTARGLSYAFGQSVRFELNAPLYFLLLAAWRHIAPGIAFMRLFSMCWAVGAILIVPALSRRYLPGIDERLTTIAVAWNPFFIWASLQIRMYAMVLCLGALLLLTFYDAFVCERPKRYAAMLYALACAASLYTEYYLAFLIAAQFAVVLAYRRAGLKRYVLSAAAAAITFAPMLAILPNQLRSTRGDLVPPDSFLRAFVVPSVLAHYVFPLQIAPARFVYAALTVAAIAGVVIGRHRLSKHGEWLLPAMTACAALLFALVTYVERILVLNRHAAGLFVAAVLSMFALVTFLPAALRARAGFAWFAIVTAASCAAIVQTYGAVANPGDWLRVVSAIRDRERPGEPIAVFEAENALPFAYYYRGPNAVVPVPAAVDFTDYDISKFIVRDDVQLHRVMPRGKRIWLITAGDCTSGKVYFGCDVLERYVGRHYTTLYDATFYRSRLRLLQQYGNARA